MRPARLLLVLLIFTILASAMSAQAQPQRSDNIILYAHSDGNLLSLTLDPPLGLQQSALATGNLTFTLSPPLGENLRILGAITVTVYLTAPSLMFGTLHVQVTELKNTGQQIPVPGTSISNPISLDSRTLPFNLGVGILDYEFTRGSTIQLQVGMSVGNSLSTPYLVWNSPRSPTSLTIPALEPTKATMTITSDRANFGRIFNSAGQMNATITANITDPLGIRRLVGSSLILTAQNGTATKLQPNLKIVSNYSAVLSQVTRLGQGSWQISLSTTDSSGNTHTFDDSILVTRFYDAAFNVVDSAGNALNNATIIATYENEGRWINATNATGWATLSLPSSEVVGPLNATVLWHGVETQTVSLAVGPSTVVKFTVPIFDVAIRITTSGIPVPNAEVWLVQGVVIVAHANTAVDGTVSFKGIPAGNYTLLTNFLFSQSQTTLNVDANGVKEVSFPTPHRNEILILFIVAVAGSTTIVLTRRRTKLYPQDFDHFTKLTMGGLPQTCFVIIAGNSGSGKSVLLESLAAEHLAQRQGCVYIINTEYPSKIRENMTKLGMRINETPNNGKLRFIDSYSAVGGAISKENDSVLSHTDLTGLGMKISKCLEELGRGTDVYLDSIMPLITVLRVDYLLNFLQSIAAKVKSNEGRLLLTVGTAIEKTDMIKLEEVADCVIETQLQESRNGQRRRLRIKKLRGKAYVDKWVNFHIEDRKGIVFDARAKSKPVIAPQNQIAAQ